ncbi:helix-turn-helix domain-containing protein [Micromonospora sp. NPDC007271]
MAWVTERQEPRFTILAALCEALDYQPGDLLRGETADSAGA